MKQLILTTWCALVFTLQKVELKLDVPIFKPTVTSSTQSLPEIQSNSGSHLQLANGYFNRRYVHLTKSDVNYLAYVNDDQEKEIQDKSVDVDHRQRLPSHLRMFSKADVAQCFDSLSTKRKGRRMHIAFVGDSTVRQHFLSFLSFVPDHDRKMKGKSTKYARYYFHEDRNVTSRLNNLLVSFHWRNLIRQDLIDDFRRWSSTDDHRFAPDFILLGVTAHHMGPNNITSNLEMYEGLLKNHLFPLINESLRVHPEQQIVWLNQSPTLEVLGPSADRATHGFSPEKISLYNHHIRRIFKRSRVIIWDSVNTIVEEYLRSCVLTRVQRQDEARYMNCKDFIHPGFGALSLATQLILNHICAAEV